MVKRERSTLYLQWAGSTRKGPLSRRQGTFNTMKERPILFSGPMVRAILDGRKTQTRRIVKPQPVPQLYPNTEDVYFVDWHGKQWWWNCQRDHPNFFEKACPYGQPGGQIWVRETWRVFGGREYEYQHERSSVIYRADSEMRGPDYGVCAEWRPSIFMPRWASRITLEITAVRVERLQDISEEDAKAEGFTHREHFIRLWDSINSVTTFDTDPWVWVIEFRRVQP